MVFAHTILGTTSRHLRKGEDLMKKFALTLLTFALVFSLSACGTDNGKNNSTTNNGTTDNGTLPNTNNGSMNNGTNNNGTSNNGTNNGAGDSLMDDMEQGVDDMEQNFDDMVDNGDLTNDANRK